MVVCTQNATPVAVGTAAAEYVDIAAAVVFAAAIAAGWMASVDIAAAEQIEDQFVRRLPFVENVVVHILTGSPLCYQKIWKAGTYPMMRPSLSSMRIVDFPSSLQGRIDHLDGTSHLPEQRVHWQLQFQHPR